MKKFDGNIVVFDLLDTYHELKEHCFKIVLSPKIFKNSHDVMVEMLDANNEPLELDVRRWGRKINCTFDLTKSVPDGVCVIKMKASTGSGKKITETFHCWVIK